MPTATRRLINWAAAFEDGALIRAAFFGLLTATAVILYLDYTQMAARAPAQVRTSREPYDGSRRERTLPGQPGCRSHER